MATRERTDLGPGTPPAIHMGAVPRNGGVEFILFSRHATRVRLLLYDHPNQPPSDVIILDRDRNRRGDLWYVFVPGLQPGQLYGYQVEGPFRPEEGHRFDSARVLLDPAAKCLSFDQDPAEDGWSSLRGDNFQRPKCVVVTDNYDWQNTRPPRCAPADAIIYETHVRGLTIDPSSKVQHPGTFLGVIEKIPYFKDLGITALELLPIQEFDHLEHARRHPTTGRLLGNYWGYSTVAFFAPNRRYSAGGQPVDPVLDFKSMVRELHRNGIEVILDVVFNHTAEGNHLGPTLNLRGIDNSIFYFLEQDRRYYRDFSGCGNSINSNHPVVRQMIRDCLRYWVVQMGVDGFRFDLASVLSRDRSGRIVTEPPLLESIAEDPMLRDTKIIAEAWDAVGAYQVGSFPGGRWAEWNGRYRDEIREFWRGDPGKTGALATRLTGSSDLYLASGRKPYHSINFVTSHDGFTLRDLVSFSQKHNLDNGEDNRDGENNNHSDNGGVEGPTDNYRINKVRARLIKNFLATLLLSQGVPMILGGDEFGRTQRGNNNAYCQDNETSWYDWSFLEKYQEFHRFTRQLIWFRRRHPGLRRREFFDGQTRQGRPVADVNWYDRNARPKDWQWDDQTLCCLFDGLSSSASADWIEDDILLLFNASRSPARFVLPSGSNPTLPWRLFLDTSNEFPMDIYPSGSGPFIRPRSVYGIAERSMACFYRPGTPLSRRASSGDVA